MTESAKLSRPSMTLTQYIMANQPPESQGDFSLLMVALQTAVKVVEKSIRRAGMSGTMGYVAEKSTNATGDDQAKLDVISNEDFKAFLIGSERTFILGSEEEDHALLVDKKKRGRYIVCFDPLDGSSNIDANVSVGSIWGIWRAPEGLEVTTVEEADKALLNKGSALVSAGYAMYGSATNLVLSCGNGVSGFTLDSTVGEFILTHPDMRIRERRSIYSVNEGNTKLWEPWFQKYIHHVKHLDKPYSLRYIGSMVADVHRTLLYGGLFLYPNDSKSKQGKLRYLYEAAPMAFLMEQAGGIASTGSGRILDVQPTKLHQRVPVFMGSKKEMELLLAFRSAGGVPPNLTQPKKKPASKL